MGKLKYILFGILLIVIWFPLVQMMIPIIKSAPLKGSFIPHSKPVLTDSTWFTGEFQKVYEEYLNDTIGFHEDFIRIRNQIDFSFFDRCHSNDTELGKNGYLVSLWYLDSHLGKVYTSDARTDSVKMMLQDLTDTLRKMNKTLLVVFAPSKTSFYKELTPSWYDLTPVHESDYNHYVKLFSNSNLNFIDFNSDFLKRKTTTKYPLFTKCGFHWSSYGSALAADSIVSFLEKKNGIPIANITIAKIEQSTKAKGSDADLNKSLNLIWNIKNEMMAYPKFAIKKRNKKKIKLLSVGDSYYYGIIESGIPDQAFDEQSFWYYNKTIFSNGLNNGKKTGEVSIKEEVENNDVIIILANETNLGKFGWGFIDKLWTAYFTKNGQRLDYYINKIKNDPKWYNEVKEKARQYNKDIDLQLLQDANYMVATEAQKK